MLSFVRALSVTVSQGATISFMAVEMPIFDISELTVAGRVVSSAALLSNLSTVGSKLILE